MSLEVKTIGQLVREAESNDKSGETTISRYVKQNMRADIDKTEAYYNSQFISGATDADGRPKPFVNICYPAVNIWYRATDLDSKDLIIRAKNDKQVIPALLATILLQQWMNSEHFGQFLNEWGHALAKHGSAVVEIVEKDGKLICRVLDWNNLIVDPIDFDANLKIKKLWLTPAQLKQNKNYDEEMVDSLLQNLEVRETAGEDKKDNKAGYIEVYEVSGELPLSYLTGDEEDDEDYTQQMQVLSFKENKKSNGKSDYEDYALFKGKQKQETKMITHLIKSEGQTYVGGAVKNLFGPQWQVNDDEKMIRDHLLLGSKLVLQGSDDAMAGKSFFSNIDNGEYLHHKPNEPITRVELSPDIAALQSHQNTTKQQANTMNGIADAMVSQAKSGTAWRQTAAELQEAHSLFELMAETKGLYLKQMFNVYILPFFKKQLENSEPISKILEAHEIKQIDSKYLPAEVARRVNKKKKDTILSGQIYDPAMEQQDTAEIGQQVQSELTGNQRFISPSKVNWKEELKDLDWDLELDVTGESQDINAKIDTLKAYLQFKQGLQGRPMDADEQVAVNELLTASGTITPLKMSFNQGTQAQPVAQPAMQPQPAT